MSSARSVREVLVAARERIAKPGGWTQRAYARDAEGRATAIFGGRAVCYCALGALTSVDADPYVYAVLRNVVEVSTDLWNDAPGRTQAQVIAAFDAAIAAQDGAA